MKIIVKTDYPVATESLDYLHPFGTVRDNTRHQPFNDKLYKLLSDREILTVLDLGCAGGGFVKNCLEDGHFAIGLEGSDINKKTRRAEWATIPENLFTCDITKEFFVQYEDGDIVFFNTITAFDVLEHIREQDLLGVLENIEYHLANDGIVIFSITNDTSIFDGTDLHVTQKPEQWWEERIKYLAGFVRRKDLEAKFDNNWLRTSPVTYNMVFSR